MVWQIPELKQQEMEHSHHEEKQGLRRLICEHSLWLQRRASNPGPLLLVLFLSLPDFYHSRKHFPGMELG